MPTNVTIPLMVVFGTDFTLWPFYLIYIPYGEYKPPFSKNSDGEVIDSDGRRANCYTAVKGIFKQLWEENRKVAVVSRRGDFKSTEQLLNLYELDQYITYKELYLKNITEHFRSIHEKSGIAYSDMLYFDDVLRNIEIAEELGVYGILVQYGLNWRFFNHGIEEYQRADLKPQKSFDEYIKQWEADQGFEPGYNPFPDDD